MTENDFRELLPPLADEEYAALKADIAAKGVSVPIVYDETGRILDGHYRKKACSELGIWNPPCIKRSGLNEDQKIEFRLSLNFNRRHVSKSQLKELAAKLRDRGWTQERISGSFGVSQRTISNWLDEFRNISELAVVEGKDGKRYSARKADRLKRKSDAPEEKNAMLDVKLNHLRGCGRQIEERSVDLVLTHSPGDYPGLWHELANVAERLLKPGKLLVLCTGQRYLPEIIQVFSKRLQYVWTGLLESLNELHEVSELHICSQSKLVLFFAARPFQCGPWFNDIFFEDLEDWMETGMEPTVIEQLTDPGDLIFDPFGNANVALAAQQLNRQLIGSESTPMMCQRR